MLVFISLLMDGSVCVASDINQVRFNVIINNFIVLYPKNFFYQLTILCNMISTWKQE